MAQRTLDGALTLSLLLATISSYFHCCNVLMAKKGGFNGILKYVGTRNTVLNKISRVARARLNGNNWE